jgi:hypothetical protein
MDDKRPSPTLAIVLVMLVLLPVLYVLSVGPMVALTERGLVSEGVFGTIYLPLIWLVDNCQPAEVFLNWYASFFDGK